MKTKFKRVFVSILAATTIFTATGPVFASKITVNMPYTIYETVDKDILSPGVVHEKILKFTVSGWWNINVLRVDLENPYVDVKGLISPEGLSKPEKVSSLVEKNNAIAGINGDFFDWSPMPWSISTLINDSEVISSPQHISFNSPSFLIDLLNQAKISYIDRKMTVTNWTSGKVIDVVSVNKATKEFDSVSLYNKYFGPKSIGTKFHNDLIEVVVDNNLVVDVRVGQEAVDIPKNGYVLVVRGEKNQGLDQFSIGDYVEFKVEANENIEDIKFAIGGGSYILENGELKHPELTLNGNSPRTGIGISEDGSQIILVTIDGRDISFKGVSQEMFGAIMKDLGAYNAINLDGGGSTTMAIKPKDADNAVVVNKPSDGSERTVVNGVGVFSNTPIGELSYIKLSTDDTNMFVNTTRDIVVKGYDEYHNPIELDTSKLIYVLEGVQGSIISNKLKAESSGKAIVTVNYGDISSSIELNVLGPVKDLTTSLSSFSMDINSERNLPTFYGKDSQGYEAKIYPEDIEFSTIKSIGHVENGKFYSGSTPIAGVLVAKVGEGLKNIVVRVGNEGKLIQSFDSLEKLAFTSYPDTVLGEISLSEDVKEGVNSLVLEYDFSDGDNTRAAYLRFEDGLAIEGMPRKLGLWVKGNGTGEWLRGTIKDSKGTSHKVDFTKDVSWSDWQFVVGDIPENISYPIVLEDIYIAEIDSLKKQSGQIQLDGLTAFYPPVLENTVLPTESSLKDEKNVKAPIKEKGYSFAVSVDPKGLNEIVQYDASAKLRDKINNHKIAVLLNGLSEEFAKGLKNDKIIDAFGGHSQNKHKDIFFLHVNTEKGGIRETNADQWNKLIDDLKHREENNIVLFLTSPVFGSNGFKDPLEADLLHKHLVEAKDMGRNIFVVHGGSSNTASLKDGIRYIELNTSPINNPEDIYKLGIVEFVVNDSEITYEINPIFEKPSVKVGP